MHEGMPPKKLFPLDLRSSWRASAVCPTAGGPPRVVIMEK
jgi:hypothetical protein